MKASPPTLIIADDESRIRSLSKKILENDQQFKVFLANNPSSAIKRINENGFDGAIIDLMFDQDRFEGEGLDIIEAFRKKEPYGFIQVVTGYDDFTDSAYKKGADHVQIKPIQWDTFAVQIKEGVVNKKLSRFENNSSFDIKTIMPDNYLEIITSNGNNFLFELDVTSEKVEIIKSFWGDQIKKENSYVENVEDLYYDMVYHLAKDLLVRYSLLSKEKVEMVERKSVDINYQKFLDQKNILTKQFPSEYVAFVDGEVVGHDSVLEKLFKTLQTYFPNKRRFIGKLDEMLEAKIRSPRIR